MNAQPIHGGLNQNRRERTLQDFASGRAPVLVATNVAARGIHVDGIDTVLHFDLPEDGKTYLHRSGRTARAGSDGLVVTLVSPEETYDARSLQREAGINLSIVPMSPGDERLKDLAGFEPPVAPPVEAPRSTYRNNRGPVPAAGPRGNGGGGGRGPRRPWQGNRGGYGGNNRRDR